MRKLVLVVIAIAFCFGANSQIKVDTYGNVKVSNDLTIVPNNNTSSGSIIMDNTGYYGMPALHGGWNGNLEIGTSSKALHKVTSYTIDEVSDKRQKENIQKLNNSLKLILSLEGVKYDIKKEYAFNDEVNDELKQKLDLKRKNHIGFLAQEVNSIIPEVVSYDDENDIYTMSYSRLIPILVEAIKEQQTMIEELKTKDKSSSKSTEINGSNTNILNKLYQNAPNPFSESTIIKYEISENMQMAMLNVYNMNGSQLKSIAINKGGIGDVVINGADLGAGMYMYALIVDNIIIDTKQMILTE